MLMMMAFVELNKETPMEGIELKPCPFCGGEPKFDKTVYKEAGVVRCQKCRASNGIVTQEHTAIKAWNTRHPLQSGDWGHGNCCSGYPNCIHKPVQSGEKLDVEKMDSFLEQEYPDCNFGFFGNSNIEGRRNLSKAICAKFGSGQAGVGLDREELGKIVRQVWIQWASEQSNPKASWLMPWEFLSEPEKEVDRRIGEKIFELAQPQGKVPSEDEIFKIINDTCKEFDNCHFCQKVMVKAKAIHKLCKAGQ